MKIIISILLACCFANLAHAKYINPAEIMGRDLNIPGLGWAGHVGITTAPMNSPAGMSQNASLVIEILNQDPAGQINPIGNFKYLSRYWGSKYGIGDRGVSSFKVLVEANHQRWWCPIYTSDTSFRIGSGNLQTGRPSICGIWRCDTFAWWAFYSQGYNTMPGHIWLPTVLFNAFPYYNERFGTKAYTPLNNVYIKSLDNVTAKELNEMPFEEFEMIMGTPPAYHLEIQPMSAEMRFAYNENLNDAKRGIMIDRLTMRGTEPDLIPKLLKLYNKTDRTEVKDKIVQGLMLYDQQHRNEQSYVSKDKALLKTFFANLLDSKSLTPKSADTAIRGFIDTHSPKEIMDNKNKIDALLPTVGHYSSIMLKYYLAFESKELQRIYIKSIIKELREANNSDLDSYLFGPLSIGYEGTGKDLLEPESKQVVVDYLKEVHDKYTPQGIRADRDDYHRSTTAYDYFNLIKKMGV